MSESPSPLRDPTRAGRRALAAAALLALSACARTDDAWRRDLGDPKSEPFSRGLAAIALAEQAQDGLDGVPTNLLEILDHSGGILEEPAQAAMLGIGAGALPEMASRLVENVFYGRLSQATLEAAIERHGAAALGPLVEAMPDSGGRGVERVERVVAAIGEAAVPPLIGILRAGPPSRSARAALLLGSLGKIASPALEPLEEAALGADPALARIALGSLQPVNPQGWRVEPILRKSLANADSGVRDAAVDGLARVLLERGGNLTPGSKPKQRAAWLEELSRLGDAAARAAVDALVPPDTERARFAADLLLRFAARWSLASRSTSTGTRTVDEEMERLVRATGRERRIAALDLGCRGRRALRAIPSLHRAASDPDAGLRFCAGLALGLLAIDLGLGAAFGPATPEGG